MQDSVTEDGLKKHEKSILKLKRIIIVGILIDLTLFYSIYRGIAVFIQKDIKLYRVRWGLWYQLLGETLGFI